MKQIVIREDEIGLWYKDGVYVKHLRAGRYTLWQPKRIEVKILKVRGQVPGEIALDTMMLDSTLSKLLEIVEVEDHEIVLVFEDKRLYKVLTPGTYGFWKTVHSYTVSRASLKGAGVEEAFVSYTKHPLLAPFICKIRVEPYQKALLYYDLEFVKVLDAGEYCFWKGTVAVSAKLIDLRQQQIEINGQEIMTEDKVNLRMNFVCQYRIVDLLQSEMIKDLHTQIYTELQLAIREYVGTYKFDDILSKKQEVGTFVLEKMDLVADRFGIEFVSAGVKDMILPGDIKEIFNSVLVAEKQAQASVIARREEVASTRSLLNTAKLMDENHTLYKLKELEYLQKICENIGQISVTGSGNIVELLTSLLQSK